MLNFKFDKAFYKEADLLKVIPIARSTFHAWQSEWISQGNDPRLMGKLPVKGTSTVYWDGAIFLKWLYENRFNIETINLRIKDKRREQRIEITEKGDTRGEDSGWPARQPRSKRTYRDISINTPNAS